MRSLFFKIFVIFWIAQSLIFVISTAVILNRRYPGPAGLINPLAQGLRSDSATAVAAYESNGCAALHAFAASRRYSAALEDGAGKRLCDSPDVPPSPLPPQRDPGLSGRYAGNRFLWTLPAASPSGAKYVLLLSIAPGHERHSWYSDLWHFAFPQLPVAIAVGGITTFVLVLIFTRPVIRLRQAARELARGKLDTRVSESGPRAGLFEGDEFQALVHDFNHMAERLESLVGAQKLLLRDVSHELRSPLARLSVALELSREDADPTMENHLNRIQREAERLNELIGQLLTLSSMEAAERADKFEAVSLNQLLKDMLPDAAYEAQQRDASVDLVEEGELVVEGRRELLYRAIENIVRNAIRYTESGTRVEVKVYRVEEKGARWAIVEVHDQGPGIPESELESIFRPFYRVDAARSAHTGGFGVGLAIAERAVKLHDGHLRAFNHEGGGATVQIRFPLR
jgi:two-component system sensor histidine kinase CpxA